MAIDTFPITPAERDSGVSFAVWFVVESNALVRSEVISEKLSCPFPDQKSLYLLPLQIVV
jgi:hypothetical protein